MAAELHTRRVVRMPALEGQPLAKARLILANANLTAASVLYRDSYEEPTTVVEQTPASGQMIYEDAEVTLWISRKSYMEHLPAIFRRSDRLGRNLVRDVCHIYGHLFGSIEDRLDELHSVFDPYDCPAEFLPWLASWTAMVVDMDWPESKQRAMIRRSVELYRIRGTVAGLTLMLKVFTGHEPKIEENSWPFRGFRVGTDARVGLDSVVLPAVDLAHCFIVTMPMSFEDSSPEMVMRIHQIIQMEKPAHTHYYLQFDAEKTDAQLREFFAIGLRSGIGVGAEGLDTIEPFDPSRAKEARQAGNGGHVTNGNGTNGQHETNGHTVEGEAAQEPEPITANIPVPSSDASSESEDHD